MLYTGQMCLRLVCIILVLIMVISAAACAVSDDTSDITADTSSEVSEESAAAQTDEYGREVIAGALPADLKFNGETVTVFLREAASIFDTRGEFIAESENGEVVNDAVYKRNTAVEETLNVQLAY